MIEILILMYLEISQNVNTIYLQLVITRSLDFELTLNTFILGLLYHYSGEKLTQYFVYLKPSTA